MRGDFSAVSTEGFALYRARSSMAVTRVNPIPDEEGPSTTAIDILTDRPMSTRGCPATLNA
jgi:hypothetical protein